MVTDLKDEFSDFYEVLTQIESIGKKLTKYKGNSNYKKSFNLKINLLDKKYILLERALSKQSNKELTKLFKKIKGDVETITSYKNPESAIEEIEFIKNKIWNKIEIQLDSEDNTLEERIYDENSPFDFHNDIRDIINLAENEVFIVEPYIDEDLLEITLRGIKNSINIRILSNLHNPKGKFVKISNKFISQHKGSFDVRETDRVHDRGIFIDKAMGWVIGQSLKQGGKKPTYIVKLRDSKKLESVYDKIFFNSTKVK